MLYSPSMSFLLQVVIPTIIVTILTGLTGFIVTQGVKEILSLFKVDLSSYAAAATALIVSVVLALLNGLLGQIPAAWGPLAQELLNLLALLLSAVVPTFGFFRVYKNIKKTSTPFR